MKGIVNFNKPAKMTSHDAVNYFRKVFNMKRIGHTGTLDPDVTGVLPICIGKATRVSEYVLEADKEYIGELTLGAKTDTQDISGEVIATSDKEYTEDDIINTFNKFTGEINQIPPMYSAVKHKGKKLYELAREGIEVERKVRKSNIYELEILNISKNKVKFRVLCSKGTYVRTLCNDIGESLGTYGYMSFLERTQVGDFKLEQSISKEYIESLDSENLESLLIPMENAILNMDSFVLSEELYDQVINGAKINVDLDSSFTINRDYKIYCRNEFIGVGEFRLVDNINLLKMKKVLV